MAVRVVTTRDQQPITVNALLQDPLAVPERILTSLRDQFVTDQLLRNVGSATGGAVKYRISSGIFTDDASEVVAETAEIPLTTVTHGDIATKPVSKYALGVAISQEMRDRNAMGEVERQLMMLRNTLVRDIDGAFLTTLTSAVTQTRAATATWATTASATIRKDINAARLLIKIATAPQGAANSYMGFEPDTLLLSPQSEADLLNSTEFNSLIFGQVNPSNISSLSEAGNVLGLRPLVSVAVPAGTAYVLQSKVVGGYADERPLQATELYEVRQNELWRSDASRVTVGFVDQPLAAAKITGV